MSGSLTCVLGLAVVAGCPSFCSEPYAPLEPIPEPVVTDPVLLGMWLVLVDACGVVVGMVTLLLFVWKRLPFHRGMVSSHLVRPFVLSLCCLTHCFCCSFKDAALKELLAWDCMILVVRSLSASSLMGYGDWQCG